MKKVDVAPDGDAEHAETTDEKKEKKEASESDERPEVVNKEALA